MKRTIKFSIRTDYEIKPVNGFLLPVGGNEQDVIIEFDDDKVDDPLIAGCDALRTYMKNIGQPDYEIDYWWWQK